MLIQHPIQPPRLILVPINPILDLLRRIAREMVRLALHRSHTGVHKEEPVGDFDRLPGAFGVAELVLFVVAGDEVLHYAAGFEEADELAVCEGVGECWNSVRDGCEWLDAGH